MSDKYAAIHEERHRFPLQLMCDALGVSASGYYAAQSRTACPRARRDEQLRIATRAIFALTRGRYGSPRIYGELRDRGERTSEKRIARLMREDRLVARRPRQFVVTTDSDHRDPIAPNLVARDFAVRDDRSLDTVWVSDITYVPTQQGHLYLAVVLDLASRRVVGWAMDDTVATTLPLRALRMAIADRRPMPGLILHSDRGSQYASAAYRAELTYYGFSQSMSAKGDCYDNAVAESFFATLEHELLAMERFATRAAARRALFEFIEVWYNRQRRHTSLGSVSPARYEALRSAA
jgi:transposase InsO family protein